MNPPNLTGRRIVLGVSGGIAAYKAVEICHRLVDAGAHVMPVLTAGGHALRRAADLLGAGLRAGPPITVRGARADPPHAPRPGVRRRRGGAATARAIGHYAGGISNDLLTATLLATRAPVLIAPAMHTEMWEHPAVQDNLSLLRRRGVHIVDPESSRLAGGDIGAGHRRSRRRGWSSPPQPADPRGYGHTVDVLAGVLARGGVRELAGLHMGP